MYSKIVRYRSSGFLRQLSQVSSSTQNYPVLTPETESLVTGIRSKSRIALSRAITLIESTRMDHRLQAELLLNEVLKSRAKDSFPNLPKLGIRVGIAGPPGAGKSTLIEVLGNYLTNLGKRVAVVAVDPSSTRSGGSILGDKTRMSNLSKNPNAFVRPSPTRGMLGGIAQYTNDVVTLCQAADFDIVIVETVGLGQSEVMVEQTVDCVIVIVPPAGGDDLQGSKKGIMEIADIVVVNKADGDLLNAARHTAADFRLAMHLQRPKYDCWTPKILLCSAREEKGLDELWNEIEKFRETTEINGLLAEKKSSQSHFWMWKQLHEQLVYFVQHDPKLKQLAIQLEEQMNFGIATPHYAARTLLQNFLSKPHI